MDDWDELLLEAMREVDAMLPGTPPIAPRRLSNDELRAALQLANAQQQFALYGGQLAAMQNVAVQTQSNAYAQQAAGAVMQNALGRWN